MRDGRKVLEGHTYAYACAQACTHEAILYIYIYIRSAVKAYVHKHTPLILSPSCAFEGDRSLRSTASMGMSLPAESVLQGL